MPVAFVTLVLALLVSACDTNVFEGLGEADGRDATVEQARLALDQGQFGTAIDLLAPLFAADPSDQEVRSLLASAYLGRGGIDLVRIVEEVTFRGDFDDEGEAFRLLVEVLPLLSQTNSEDLARSRDLLADAASPLSRGDCLQLAIASASHLVAVTVLAFDPEQDGSYEISPKLDVERVAAAMNEDLGSMITGVGCSAMSSASEIIEFLEQLRSDIDSNGDGVISADEVRHFVDTVLA